MKIAKKIFSPTKKIQITTQKNYWKIGRKADKKQEKNNLNPLKMFGLFFFEEFENIEKNNNKKNWKKISQLLASIKKKRCNFASFLNCKQTCKTLKKSRKWKSYF